MTSNAELKCGVIAAVAADPCAAVATVATEPNIRRSPEHGTCDTEIADSAKRVIRWTTIEPDGFRVAVDHGWVTLQGEAWYDLECRSVENAIRGLPGVAGVTNQIAIARGSVRP